MSKTKQNYLTIKDVAKRMGVVPHTAWNWCQEGKLNFTRDGLAYRIAETDFQSMQKCFNSGGWIKMRKVGTNPVTMNAPAEPVRKTTNRPFTRKQVFDFVEYHLTSDQILELRLDAERECFIAEAMENLKRYMIEDFKQTRQLIRAEER